MVSNQVLQAIADELGASSIGETRSYEIKDSFDPDQVKVVLVVTDYPGMGFSPETERRVTFEGSRCRAFDILCGKVNGK